MPSILCIYKLPPSWIMAVSVLDCLVGSLDFLFLDAAPQLFGLQLWLPLLLSLQSPHSWLFDLPFLFYILTYDLFNVFLKWFLGCPIWDSLLLMTPCNVLLHLIWQQMHNVLLVSISISSGVKCVLITSACKYIHRWAPSDVMQWLALHLCLWGCAH